MTVKKNSTTPKIKCNKCKVLEAKNLRYVLSLNGDKHLAGSCDVCGTVFLPFREGLDIPTTKSKKLSKREKRKYKRKITQRLF